MNARSPSQTIAWRAGKTLTVDASSRLVMLDDDSEQLPVGALLNGRYVIIGDLGNGGMGRVYQVADGLFPERKLALKTIRGFAVKGERLSLFKAEFKVMAKLRHPNVASVYDFEPSQGSDDYLFTMELIEGTHISEALKGAPWSRVLDLIVPVCRALAYVHSRNVIHSDIKPHNVLVGTHDRVKVLDFGLAGAKPGGQALIGTPTYMAPEMIEPVDFDHRADLYSLGIMLYELLCGRPPFIGDSLIQLFQQHSYEPIAFDAHAKQALPDWLRAIVAKLCAKSASDRFRSANAVIAALNNEGDLAYELETQETRNSYLFSSQLVGREEEFERVTEFIEARTQDNGPAAAPALFVAGPSGVGKSRLMREVRQHAQLSLLPFLESNCYSSGGSEYGPVVEVLGQLGRLADAIGAIEVLERFAPAIVRIAPELGDGLASLAAGPTVEDKTLALEQVAEFVVQMASRTPFVVYVNDLQWAQPGAVDLLVHVVIRAKVVAASRLAILGTYRDDEVEGRPLADLLQALGAKNALEGILLGPLDRAATAQLMRSMLGVDVLPGSFVEQVARETEGNPFFIEEVMRTLVERGAVAIRDGCWAASDALGAPPSIANVFLERARQLAPFERAVIDLMAVDARPTAPLLLAEALGASLDDVHDALSALVQRQMILRLRGDELLYRIGHDRMAEALYGALSAKARAHERLGAAIERLYAGDERQLYLLAYHFSRTSLSDKTLAYSLAAGEKAASEYQTVLAIELLERALSLMPADDDRRAELEEKVAELCRAAGRYADAAAWFERTLERVTNRIARGRLIRKQAQTLHEGGASEDAVARLWHLLATLGEAKRPRTGLGRALALLHACVALALRRIFRRWAPSLEGAERERVQEAWRTYSALLAVHMLHDTEWQALTVVRMVNSADKLGLRNEVKGELFHAPAKASLIEPGLYHIKLTIGAAYLLETEAGLVLVNTGMPGEETMILNAVRQLGYAASDPQRIIVPCTYPDNVGALAALQAATGASICVHALDAEAVREGRNFSSAIDWAPGWAGMLGHILQFAGVWDHRELKRVPVEQELSDGQVLPGGITIVHTPGNTPGGVCVLWRRTLLVGCIFNLSPGLGGYFLGYEDLETAYASMRKIMTLDFDNVAAIHSKPIIGHAKKHLANLTALKRAMARRKK